MTGAGISVSAGIPDFRSPKTGVYANLAEYNLPSPESLFTLSYFLEKPEPFYKFCAQNFDLSKYEPTPTHHFIKMVNDMGILKMCMTQNIDNLEAKTAIDMSKVLQCHGANRGALCAKCKKPADEEEC
jgi:NAD-dependent SIR2 family protein deacetylase